MHHFFAEAGSKIHVLQLTKDEYLLEEICRFVKENGVRNGIVLTGVGTLKRCRYHGVTSLTLPARDEYYEIGNEPIEFSGLSGIIADYEPHLHMVMTIFTDECKTICAHVEPGCVILCLGEITILQLDNVQMSRQMDSDMIKQLTGKYTGPINDANK